MFFPGSGNNLFGHLHVADAARALIKAAEGGMQGLYVIADDLAYFLVQANTLDI